MLIEAILLGKPVTLSCSDDTLLLDGMMFVPTTAARTVTLLAKTEVSNGTLSGVNAQVATITRIIPGFTEEEVENTDAEVEDNLWAVVFRGTRLSFVKVIS